MIEPVELNAAAGFVEPQLRDEFPGLRLDWLTIEGSYRESPPEVARRLQDMSNRYRGANVVAMRGQPIPLAYRSFFRQIGLDPDVQRTPIEEAAVGRLMHGHFRSRDHIHDALLIALLETGVPVWALDGDLVEAGGLGIRTAVHGDKLGSTERATHVPPGRLVVADARWVHGTLFDAPAHGHGVSAATRRVALFTVSVEGVPAMHVEEALWVCVEVLNAGRAHT